jgi:basic amino acid/polyamine antiporter, APA family
MRRMNAHKAGRGPGELRSTGRGRPSPLATPPAKLTLWPGVGLVAANMIGAGVFLSAGFMAQRMGPGAILLAWVAGALLALAGARAYAELARLVPRSGGEYRYLSELTHPALGYLAGWASLLVGFSAPVAVDALAAGEFAATALPVLHVRLGFMVAGHTVTASGAQLVAAGFIAALTAAHAVGLRTSTRVQNVLVVVKIVLLAGFVVVGAAFGRHAWPTWSPPDGGAGFPFGPFAESLFFIAFAFSGWNAVAYAAEDFERPERTVPKAMVVGCLAVAGLYLVVNWIFVANLTPADASVVFRYDSDRVTLGHAVVERLLGGGFGAVMAAFTVLVFLSAMSAMTFVGPRVYAAMAKDGYLPRALAGKDGRPPAVSVVLQGALAIAIVFTQSLRDVLGSLGAILTFFAALTAAGLFRAAVRPLPGRPAPRPAALAAAFVYAASALAMFAFAYRGAPSTLLWVAGVLAFGLVAYALSRPRPAAGAAGVETGGEPEVAPDA